MAPHFPKVRASPFNDHKAPGLSVPRHLSVLNACEWLTSHSTPATSRAYRLLKLTKCPPPRGCLQWQLPPTECCLLIIHTAHTLDPYKSFCWGPAWGTPPMAKVMRKEAWHTQRRDQASGNPCSRASTPKPESVLCSHLHLWLYGGLSHITVSLGEGVNVKLQGNKNSWVWQECFSSNLLWRLSSPPV